MLQALPDKLSDEEWRLVGEIARAPVPELPRIGDEAFAQVMKLIDTLPRKRDDDQTGEIRFRVYGLGLRHLPSRQIWWTVEQAIRRCKWCPTVKELIDIAEEWKRADEPTLAKREAGIRFHRERNRRLRIKSPAPALTQDMVDAMTEEHKRLGLRTGALIEQDGRIIPNPEPLTTGESA